MVCPPPDAINATVRRFVVDHIDSVEQLDVLIFVLMHAEKSWNFSEISLELRSTEASIRRRAQSLVDCKVLAPEALEAQTLRYSPFSPEINLAVQETAAAYRVHQYKIMDLIFGKKVDALNIFADSFRIKKEEEE